jgi:hypothetical protein
MAFISLTHSVSNTHRPSRFSEKSSQNIEQIYDKYAPVIYGIINSLTDNVMICETIFTDIFLKIKDNLSDFKMDGNVCPRLMRYTYTYTVQRLMDYGISPKVNITHRENKLMNLFCTAYESLDEMASSLKIPTNEIRKSVRKEYSTYNQQQKLIS